MRERQLIGPYVVLRKHGGKKEIYFAFDRQTNKKVVLKKAMPMKGISGYTPEEAGRIALEYEHSLQSRLSNSNICPVDGPIREYDKHQFMVTKLIGIKHLGQYAKEGLSRQERISVLEDIARALVHCHAQNIVHLDVKEENIVVHRKRGILIDFGAARSLDEVLKIGNQYLLLTPSRASPEHASARGFTKRSDVFSFALVAYKILSGKEAFQIDHDGKDDWIMYDRPNFDFYKQLEKYGDLGRLLMASLDFRFYMRPSMAEVADVFREVARQYLPPSARTSAPCPETTWLSLPQKIGPVKRTTAFYDFDPPQL